MFLLTFVEGKTIEMLIFSEMVSAGAKIYGTAIVDFDVCQRRITLWKLYSNDLDLLFEGQKFETVKASGEKNHRVPFIDFLYLSTYHTITKIVPYDVDLLSR